MRSDDSCATQDYRFNAGDARYQFLLQLRKDSTPKPMLYNITLFNEFDSEPVQLVVEFIDQNEITSFIRKINQQTTFNLSESGIANMELLLEVNSSLKGGLELRSSEFTRLAYEKILNAECRISGLRMVFDVASQEYEQNPLPETLRPCNFEEGFGVEIVSDNLIRINITNQNWSSVVSTNPDSGNGLPFYLINQATYSIMFDIPISNEREKQFVDVLRNDAVDNLPKFGEEDCLNLQKTSSYLETGLDWNEVNDCINNIADKDEITLTGIHLFSPENFDVRILCPQGIMTSKDDILEWIDLEAR